MVFPPRLPIGICDIDVTVRFRLPDWVAGFDPAAPPYEFRGPMRRSYHLIANPKAGRGRQSLVADVATQLAAAGANVQFSTGSSEAACFDEARKIVRTQAVDVVVAAGGDGTIRLAAKAVAGSGVPLGVIPVGTGNVLANEVHLPRDAGGLAQLLLTGKARAVNTATANGELFLLMAGAGFDGRIIAGLDHGLKNRIGKLAFFPPLLRALARGADQLGVEIDGRPYKAAWAVVANASRYGGAFVMAPGTSITTPGLEVVLLHGALLHHRLAQLMALGLGRLAAHPASGDGAIDRVRGSRVEITSAEPVPVQLDGDTFVETPLSIRDGGPEVLIILP